MKKSLCVPVVVFFLITLCTARAQVNYTWSGAADNDWGNALNWAPPGVPGTTGADGVTFDDTAPSATINVPSNVQVFFVDFKNVTSTFTLTGGSIGLVDLTRQPGGTTIIHSQISFENLDVEANSELSMLNVNNAGTGSAIVRSGGTLHVITSGSANGIGSADIDLRGGTINFLPGGATLLPGLEERWYNLDDFACGDGAALFDALHVPLTTNNPSSFLNRIPDAARPLDRALQYTGGEMNTRSGGTVGVELVGGLWIGQLNVGAGLLIEPGSDLTFGTRSDDGSVVWLDVNQNGVFDDPDEMVVDNQRDHGAQNRVGTVSNLAAGVYSVGIGFWERCGGEFMEARIATGVVAEAQYNTMALIDPSDAAQAGLWTHESIAPGVLTNAVTLRGDSTIGIGANLFGVDLGQLSVDGSHTLHVVSETMRQNLGFSSATLNGDLTLSQTNMAEVTLENISESLPANLTIDGDGVVFLTTSNRYTGTTFVNAGGTLEINVNGALGATNGVTQVADGGSLRLTGAFDYALPEALQIAGTGSPKSTGALNQNGGGNTEWRGPITLIGDATIHNQGNILSLHNLIDNAGFELHFNVVANDIQIEGNASITGAGDVRLSGGNARFLMFNGAAQSDFTGDVLIEGAIWDARGNDSLGSDLGSTRILPPGRLELRDGRTLGDDIFVSGNGNNNGAIFNVNNNNTLTGVITLEGDTTWRVLETSLIISNRVDGAFQLTKQDTGTLVFGQDNGMSEYVHQSGEVRISSAGAFGGTTNLNVQHAALEFDGDMTFDASGPLQTLVIGNTTFAPLSGTTVLDLALDLSTQHVFAVSGDGDLEVVQGFGTPGRESATNALNHYGYHLNNDGFAMDLTGNRGMMNGGNPRLFDGLHQGVFLENGPGDRGLDFNGDGDFRGSGAVDQNDNFSNLFLGYLNVTNGAEGVWALRVEQRDDPVGMWIDLNQNGVFESTIGGLGSNRGEQLAWNNDTGAKTNDLAVGRYLVAFTHREGGGGSGIDINFQSPLMGAEATVKPGDPAQHGIWTPFEVYDSNLIKDGAGTLTLSGNNNYSGLTDIREGAVIIRDGSALGNPSEGTVIAAQAELGFGSSIQIDNLAEFLDFQPCSVLANIDGTNFITGTLPIGTGASGRLKIRSDFGRLQLSSVNLADAGLEVSGNADTEVLGVVFGNGSHTLAVAGLRAAFFDLDASANAVPNSVPAREDLIEPASGNNLAMENLVPLVVTNLTLIDFGDGTETVPGDGSVLDRGGSNGNPFGGLGINAGSDRHAGLFTGFLNIPEAGAYAITTRSDDGSRAWLDLDGDGCFDASELVAESQGHHGMVNRTQGLMELQPGLYGFKAAFFEGGGGSGMQVSWEHPTGDNPFGREIITNAFFTGTVAVNDLVKEGFGTLSLGPQDQLGLVNNTYDGGTLVLDGRLLANQLLSSNGSGDVRVLQHGVFGGIGHTDPSAIEIGPGGALSPGISPGTLTVNNGDLTFAGVSNNPAWFIAELDGATTPGTDYDQLVQTGGTFNASSGSLLATHAVGYEPQPGEVLTIVETDTVLGTFTNLPDGASVNASGEEFIIHYNDLARDTITLTATGTNLLYAGPDLVFREEGQPLTLSVAELLLNDSASEAGGPLSVVAVQTQTVNGASVSLANDEITYSVTNTFNRTDTFRYTITDAGLGTIQGVVTVVVAPGSDALPPVADISGLVVIGGLNRVTFTGEPGRQYVIDYTDDLTTTPIIWTPVSGPLSPDSGGGFFVDHDSPTAISYYRARTQ